MIHGLIDMKRCPFVRLPGSSLDFHDYKNDSFEFRATILEASDKRLTLKAVYWANIETIEINPLA